MHACLVQTRQSREITGANSGGENIMDMNPALEAESVWTK